MSGPTWGFSKNMQENFDRTGKHYETCIEYHTSELVRSERLRRVDVQPMSFGSTSLSNFLQDCYHSKASDAYSVRPARHVSYLYCILLVLVNDTRTKTRRSQHLLIPPWTHRAIYSKFQIVLKDRPNLRFSHTLHLDCTHVMISAWSILKLFPSLPEMPPRPARMNIRLDFQYVIPSLFRTLPLVATRAHNVAAAYWKPVSHNLESHASSRRRSDWRGYFVSTFTRIACYHIQAAYFDLCRH